MNTRYFYRKDVNDNHIVELIENNYDMSDRGMLECTKQEYILYKNEFDIFTNGTEEDRRIKEIKGIIRQHRKILFDIFDIYKSNLSYGIELMETEIEKTEINSWYKDMLDLPETINKDNYTDEIIYPNLPIRLNKYIDI